MNKLTRFFRSLPVKLSLIVTGLLVLIWLVMAVDISSTVRRNMYNNGVDRSANAIHNMAGQVESFMEMSQAQILNVAEMIEQSVNTSFDATRKYLDFFVKENPWAATAKLAFLPGKGEDCAYISYTDAQGNYAGKTVTSKEDYATWDWYKTALRAMANTWCEPYYNRTQKLIVNTFSCPIRDLSTGEIMAFWAVDVKFIELNGLLESYMPFNGAYGYIISSEGRYMAHPHKACRLKTFQELDAKYQSPGNKKVYDLMLAPESGVEVVEIDGEKCLVSYSTINSIAASIAIICPFSEFFNNTLFVQKYIWQLLSMVLALVVIVLFFLTYWIMRPLRGFAAAVRAVAHGEYNAPLPKVTTQDELRDFYEAMRYMQESLEKNIEQLTLSTAAAARIDSELMFARNIQQDLLVNDFPPYLDVPQLELYAKLQPARAVGGDLYDFFLRDNKLFFVIADVSGKGIPASLFMAMACKLFRVLSSKEDSPTNIAKRMNNALSVQNKENMFITMFIGVLDLVTGELRYTNAGHNPPLIVSSRSEDCRYMDLATALPIAVFKRWEYADCTLQLAPHETLLLYTDGVVEAENPSKALYGEDRLLALARAELNALGPEEMVNRVYADVESFSHGADQSDDITLLCLRYSPLCTTFQCLEDVASLPQFVRSVASRFGIAQEEPMLNLALEELIVNIFMHSNAGKVSLRVSPLRDKVCFTLVDAGFAFDPSCKQEVDLQAAPKDRKVGGLGLYFAQQIFSHMEYRRMGKLNVLYAYFPR